MDEIIMLTGLALFTLVVNVPLGMWRETVRKFSLSWIVAIHASVPVVIALRIWLGLTNWSIPILIAIAILGQYIGSRVYRNKVAISQVKKVGE